jgi:hypothetical protein
MHISRLPSRVMKALGIDRTQYANALKLIQAHWCAPLGYQELCPKTCEQCEAKLMEVAAAARRQSSINLMGLWKYKLRHAASIAIEEGRAGKPEAAGLAGTVAEAAARMLQEMGLG